MLADEWIKWRILVACKMQTIKFIPWLLCFLDSLKISFFCDKNFNFDMQNSKISKDSPQQIICCKISPKILILLYFLFESTNFVFFFQIWKLSKFCSKSQKNSEQNIHFSLLSYIINAENPVTHYLTFLILRHIRFLLMSHNKL